MRARFCKVCKDWHKPEEWPAECWRIAEKARSTLPGPMIQTDTMSPVKSMTNGQIYDSKSALRSEYKRAGVTEIGNEKLKPYTIPRPKKKDVQATVEKALSRAGLGA